METVSQARIELKRRFADFLDATFEFASQSSTYGLRALDLLYAAQNPRSVRIKVQSHDVRAFDANLLSTLLENPTDGLPAFQDAVKEYIKSRSDEFDPNESEVQSADEKRKHLKLQAEKNEEWMVGLEGDLGTSEVSPRDLLSNCLGRLVKVYGIVTKVSLVRPKITKSVHYCEMTKSFTTREYRDATSFNGPPTGSAMPTRDDKNNPLTTEYGRCKYLDHQTVTIQELPETAPAGQLPHSADIILEGDLVDACKPGDRIAVYGVYKAYQGKGAGTISGVCKASLIGTTVQVLTKTNRTKISPAENLALIKLCQEGKALETLAASLAPSIYGHELVKKGLVLMLVGGEEKNLKNGTHLRGDVNCLMVGDPGVAKSQLLRAVMTAAPHAVSTTGRGSSGVGLTAAVTTEGETGEKRLEAGAMVLADRGVVCIDEFDKMSDQDRVAIHEVMEQQTVTIAKAGIQASLNARCSVLAAANPLFGTYDRKSSITKNVALPDSLLSRFDLLFVVLDSMDEAKDRRIAAHVLAQHSYRQPGDDGRTGPQEGTIHDMLDGGDDKDDSDGDIYAKYDPRLHGKKRADGIRPLKPGCLRKFVINMRKRYDGKSKVELTPAAVAAMRDFYIELRASAKDRALPITARTLETIVRLSTAHAKLRWSWSVEPQDVAVARKMMEYVLRRDVAAEPEEDGDAAPQQQRRSRKRKAPTQPGTGGAAPGQPPAPGADGGEDMDGGDDDEGGAGAAAPPSKRAATGQPAAAGAAEEEEGEELLPDENDDEGQRKLALDLPEAQAKPLIAIMSRMTDEAALNPSDDPLEVGGFTMASLMQEVEAAGLGLTVKQVRGYIFHLKYMPRAQRTTAHLPEMVWYTDKYIARN